MSSEDLHGSDLENMSLSKRFLKEEREEILAAMEGDRVSGPKLSLEVVSGPASDRVEREDIP